MSSTSELDKLSAIQSESQAIGSFLEWLNSEGIHIAEFHSHDSNCVERENGWKSIQCGLSENSLYRSQYSINSLLARYFEIDTHKVDTEKKALLAKLGREQ